MTKEGKKRQSKSFFSFPFCQAGGCRCKPFYIAAPNVYCMLKWIILIILIIVLVALVPIISIWALNTLFVGALFSKPIELNIYTYLAMLWFGGMLGAGAASKSK